MSHRSGLPLVSRRRVALTVGCALVVALTGLRAPAVGRQDAPAPIHFARHPALSPDGRTLAFSYQGDIWTVPAQGGTAARITIHEAHDELPAWSPDGKWIAFSSKREGSYDVWLIAAGGGPARRLTCHPADDLVCGWSPDGREVLFSSSRETTRTTSIYAVNVRAGASRLVREDDIPLSQASFSPDGKWVACTRGGSWTRKGYRGSGSANLLLVPAQGGAGEWLTHDAENERWPMFVPDGRTLYYVGDHGGTPNLWRKPLRGGHAVQVTHHTDGNVLYPTMVRDGSRVVYEHNFGLWSVDLPGGTPHELRVLAPTDDRTNAVRHETFTTGAQEAALSPDGKQIAFVVHGEVFIQPAAGGEATRLTDTPQREDDIDWSPDGKRLAFVSDRDGNAEVYTLDVQTKEARRLTNTPRAAEHAPRFSPDGKWLAFTRGGEGIELHVAPAGGGESRMLARDPSIGAPAWSPDGKWIAYSRTKSHSAGAIGDVFVVNVADPKPANVTRWFGVSGSPAWTPDGKSLLFLSNRSSNNHVWRLPLQDDQASDDADAAEGGAAARPRPGAEGAASPRAAAPAERKPVVVQIDFADIHKRARQVTGGESSVSSFAVAPDGKSVVFALAQMGRTDLWRTSLAGGSSPSRLTQTGEAGASLQFSPDGSQVVYLSGGAIRSLSLGTPGATPSAIAFSARMDIDTHAELAEMFDEAWRNMRDSFYDEKMHGCDWDHVRATYRPVLADITYREDFYALFSLALGELNASHVGISPPRDAEPPNAPSLGVAFDDTYPGPGLRVRSVVPRGPADRERSRLRPGDVLARLDGQPLTTNEALYGMLAGKSAKRVEITVAAVPAQGTTPAAPERTVRLRPISGAAHRQLVYDDWVRQREQAVDKLSGGKLAYVHLPGMGAANLDTFKRAVFADAQDKGGLVLDLRFNGGGSIADEMFGILEDRVFGYRTIRGDPQRLPAPLPAFDKPIIVLINESAFSNAEVFPWGFRALKLGKIVGVPTFGGVIGTGGTTLIDGTSLRIPAVGSYTLDGKPMENNGCPPDILVEHTPEDIYTHQDRQLERAVAELLKDVRP